MGDPPLLIGDGFIVVDLRQTVKRSFVFFEIVRFCLNFFFIISKIHIVTDVNDEDGQEE